MANEKQINSRIQHKHDIEAHWYAAGTATNPFIPKAGELIIYDPDDNYGVRTKIGDGGTPVHLLPWASGCDESVGLAFQSNGDGTCQVSGIGSCTDTDIVIPLTSPDGDSVTGIGNEALFKHANITSVTIPDSVTTIGHFAFEYCESLASIDIPDSVTSIGDYAFENCTPLTSVVIPDSVTSIGLGTFKDCISLTSIIIPDGVTSIGDDAFYACNSLTSIVIPNSVTTIGFLAFEGCKSLTDVYYSGSKTEWNNINIGSYNESLTNAAIHYGYFDNFQILNKKFGDTTTLETKSKEVVGAINELTAKALGNAECIILANNAGVWYEEDGVWVEGEFYALKDEGETDVLDVRINRNIPIAPGNNVTFTVENQLVKINATGGEIDTSKFVSKYTIETGASTTVLDVINAIQNAGGNIGEWNVIVLTGYITETWGLQISHHGSTVYSIQGVNLNNMKTVSNTASWSGVSLGSFQTMFKPAIPYCNSSNEDQFLRVVSGAPAWVSVPNAEEASF